MMIIVYKKIPFIIISGSWMPLLVQISSDRDQLLNHKSEWLAGAYLITVNYHCLHRLRLDEGVASGDNI